MAADRPVFNEIIHAPQRLRICAMLSAAHKIEFSVLQDRLALSKSALSKHLTQLTDVGYIRQDRAVRDSRSRVWVSLTPEGSRAYSAHLRALRQIANFDDL